MTAGLDIEALSGVGDSGALPEDLTDLFVAIGEAARDRGVGVVFLIDEIQHLRPAELEARSSRCTSAPAARCLSRWLAPVCRRFLASRERPSHTASGYSAFRGSGSSRPRTTPATRSSCRLTLSGWHLSQRQLTSSSITRRDTRTFSKSTAGSCGTKRRLLRSHGAMSCRSSHSIVEAELDESFFHVHVERTTDLELRYLYAMAELGPDPHGATEVAARIRRTAEQAGPIRSRLIDKGLLYTPGRGYAAFTLPQFDRYMLCRHFAD